MHCCMLGLVVHCCMLELEHGLLMPSKQVNILTSAAGTYPGHLQLMQRQQIAILT